ncbi:esterase [Bordetella genomosp. 8]|uniref:Esterase n=1 Tax=Bordetella genomosp. 8 TaxID=1416806 RepID=A0A1W6YGB3_9BORD|nr:alpha/beta hydrolase [Bordetella genomosp. 8]ARP80058.1 esterase [Bordetella genomosp. 8]
MAHAHTGQPKNRTVIVPITPEEISREAALRERFARFWAETKGAPRDVYDVFIAATPMASGAACEAVEEETVHGWWIRPLDGAAPPVGQGSAILYIHGGGYVQGSAKAYRGFVSQLVALTGIPALAIDYPLAPEATLPAATSAALAAWDWLVARGCERIAIVGDSAGGGLTLSTLIQLAAGTGQAHRDVAGHDHKARREPRPVAGVVFSPWTDLAFTGASMRDPAVQDPLIGFDYLRDCARKYLGDAQPRDPLASPLHGDLRGLPPLLIQVGTDERLLDDSRQFAERAAAAGARVELEIWQGMHHVFQLDLAHLESSRTALAHAANFLRAGCTG